MTTSEEGVDDEGVSSSLTADGDAAELGGMPPRDRARRSRRIMGGFGLALLVAGGVLWIERRPIADHFIAQQLKSQGITARYQITRIGPRTQRLENVVIGNPSHPDLVAHWVEVDVGFSGFSPTVRAVRASGVRLRGVLRDGALSFGAIDQFLKPGEKGAKGLPDINLAIMDATLALASDYGSIGLAINGSGDLHGGFIGRLVAASPGLKLSGCSLAAPRASLAIAAESTGIALSGPLTAPALRCGDARMTLAAPRIDADLRFSSALDTVKGALTLASPGFRQGLVTMADLSGLITLDGDLEKLIGNHAVSARSIRSPEVRAGRFKIGGAYAIRLDPNDRASSVSGSLTLDDLAMNGRSPLSGVAVSLAGTPLEPLATELERAVKRAGEGNRLTAAGKVDVGSYGARALLSRARFVAESGARIELSQDTSATLFLPSRRWGMDGELVLAGGGLPDAKLLVHQRRDGTVTGLLRMEPYAANGARLMLAPLRFSIMRDGAAAFSTVATLDGPLADGAVSGLSFPLNATVTANGVTRLAGGCAPLGWKALRISSAVFNPATLRVCSVSNAPLVSFGAQGVDGAVRIAPIALNGRIGSSPLALTASSAQLQLDSMRFALTDLSARIGDLQVPAMLDAGRVEGGEDASTKGFAGLLADGRAHIGSVPLDLSAIKGRWTFRDGALALDGSLDVADSQTDRRFNPLHAPDARLTLADGRIDAKGTLRLASRGRDVSTVAITHDLSSGRGHADLDLGALHFGDSLQPDDLTPLALGVVANVDGTVTGAGHIDWTSDGVTSTGRFETRDMKLAAAFGPVEGLSSTIDFVDLLGMRTAPHQLVTLRSVNPGIEVRDGAIRYALLSSSQAQIESGHWPFAGGSLDLLPVTLDLDAKKARNLAFRVTGLDAGAFINTLELKDISATGTYDGLLPMVFDADGGRIEGGILVARQPGSPPLIVQDAASLTVPCDPTRVAGTLAYVGEVSNAQLGTFGKLAFDALKNLKYKCLTILMDGAIDGEFVTQIAINGVNQGTPAAASSAIARPFLGLPFLFNVRIEAPFRGLLNTARSFTDPSDLIRASLGAQYQTVLDNSLAVQGVDSEKTVKGDKK